MSESLAKWLVGVFGGLTSIAFGKQLVIFIISMLPILELRGGLIAASLLNLGELESFIICFIGNILPIPFILWLVTPLFGKLKKTKKLAKFVERLENRALSKRDQIEKYQYWGLMLFVGIPLPGTGAWTGCLIAALLGMNKKKAMVFSILGVLMAGIIMMLVSFGILGNIIR